MIGTSTLLSAIGGSLTGLVGHWFTAREEAKKREHEKNLITLQMEQDKLNSELRLKEIAAGVQIEEARLEGHLLIEEAKDFNKAVVETTKNKLNSNTLELLITTNWATKLVGLPLAFLLGLTDVFRSSIRPLLTLAAFSVVVFLIQELASRFEILNKVDQLSITLLLLDLVAYVVTASVQFWFMDRQGARAYRKKH